MSKTYLIDREERVRDYLLPRAVKSSGGAVQRPEAMLLKKPLQIALGADNCMTVNGGGYIILDFGCEIHGGVRILTHAAAGNTTVRLRFGESVSETCSELIGTAAGATATNDHSVRDFNVTLVSWSDMSFGQTGFRFVRLDFGEGAEIAVQSVAGVFEHRVMERTGMFECSDKRLNEIYATSAYTLELCLQNMIWDGIKRDRLVWAGDLHPEILGIISLYGSDVSVERSLTFNRECTPLPEFMNRIPAYSLWWLCCIGDYYFHNGNLEYIKGERDYILRLTELVDSLIGPDGRLNFDYNFIDWQTEGAEEAKSGNSALCALAMKKIKPVFRALGLDEKLPDRIISRLDGSRSAGEYKQIAALKFLAGQAGAKETAAMLKKGGAAGFSTFMSYYIASALAETGETSEALRMLKEYYGGMLDRGATTFWEDFDLSWLKGSGRIDELPRPGEKDIHGDFGAHCYKGFRHSLCHGWSCGPIIFFTQYVLGIKELEPGCRKLLIAPDLCGLEYARGLYPTPYGPVRVEVKTVNGKTETEIDAPEMVTVVRD